MAKRRRHGWSKHPLYTCWINIKQRCLNPRNPEYRNYGARGISIADEWRENPGAFIEWIIQHLGDRPNGHEIDRINNDGDYAPGNLKWSSHTQNLRNQRRNRLVKVGRIALPIAAWADLLHISKHTIRWRLENGWSDVDAVMTPPGGQRVSEIIPQSVQRWQEQAKRALRSLAPYCRNGDIPLKLQPIVFAMGGICRAKTVEDVHRAAKSAQLGFPTVSEVKQLERAAPEITGAFAVCGEIEFESLAERLASN